MKRLKVFVLFLVAVVLLTACGEKAPAAKPTLTATATAMASATAAATRTPTPTATASATAMEESICSLSNQGVQIDFSKTPDEDKFYVLSGSMKELQPYSDCNFLVEGRVQLVEEHHIWVFTGTDWYLEIREGSLWAYPESWNMDDFSAEKAPITTEFVVAKRRNQLQNGYDWPIFVHQLSGNTVKFPAGSDLPEAVLPDNADFAQPEPLEIHGVWDSKSASFNASIGAEGVTTVALLDGQLVYWVGAQDNVVYKSVEAWLMPSKWSQGQIEAWAKAQFPKKELGPYKPAD